MIPTEQQAKELWEKYHLPQQKRIHSQSVAHHAMSLARTLRGKNQKIRIHMNLLLAGCLLHDIDKNIPPLPGETHPQTGVRILTEEGMHEVAQLIRYHSVQFIDNPKTAPKTIEEKLLFLSDKMVKQEVIGIDRRFKEWLAQNDLPEDQKQMLQRVYPKVKALEREVLQI
jgi:putative nucleotidyltransferase with HDIG domain